MPLSGFLRSGRIPAPKSAGLKARRKTRGKEFTSNLSNGCSRGRQSPIPRGKQWVPGEVPPIPSHSPGAAGLVPSPGPPHPPASPPPPPRLRAQEWHYFVTSLRGGE